MEIKNSKTGMAHEEMKQFIRNHFEEFVNKQNLAIADVNFAPDFVDHGADVPPGTAPGPAGGGPYVGGAAKPFPGSPRTLGGLVAGKAQIFVAEPPIGTTRQGGRRNTFRRGGS